MFLSSLHTPLVALVAYVAVVSSTSSASAPPSLSVKTSISDPDIDGVGNLKVTATIVNTGGESLKLFNDPRGVLDPFPDDSFTFANPSGSRPSFKGARVNRTSGYVVDLRADARSQASYNSTLAASPDGPGVFTVLAPGGSVNVTHDREWIVSISFYLARNLMISSLRCVRLHSIRHRGILHRTLKPLHLYRC